MSSSPNLYLLIALAPLAGAILAGLFGTGFLGRPIGRRGALQYTMLGVLIFTVGVTSLALNSQSSIYEMVENAYKVTLVAAFVPLAFGVYWKRATRQGALMAMVLGLLSWITLEYVAPEGLWPPQLAGLLFSIGGMVVGSLMPQLLAPMPPILAAAPEGSAQS